ncbi:multicopper oxidase family protein [Streptomyces sp. ADMS]|uniref:multicopper oxidase family protein n=1 Tax=Streptomyces sp. ADMS TaxID=3071415 RepID=UPI00296E6845|nr:multicopper oxidase family protein [Streptomyces sp. ADMS]MDW4905919.1 multicopper oxidase family protein [Streptomyces sp. ADMS]
MFETLLNADLQAALLTFMVWTTGAVLMSRRPVERSRRRGKARAVTLLVLAGLGTLLVLGRILTVTLMGRVSWLFAVDRVAVALPLLAVPAAAVLAGSVPRLVAWARTPSLDTRTAAFSPTAVVPFQTAAAGAFVGLWTALVTVLAPPLLTLALLIHSTVVLLAAFSWLGQTRRWLSAVRTGPRPRRSRPVRALRALAVVTTLAVTATGLVNLAATSSRLPASMSMAPGDAAQAHQHGGGRESAVIPSGTTSVTSLTGPRDDRPDRRFTLVAKERTVRLASGKAVRAWAFNGQVPGPVLRVRQGELVEITVRNELRSANVAVHWHGVDVPNAEDGVPGVTQNATRPGATHVYRFRPDESGTHWYHSHQQTSVQVVKGLFGALIIDPPKPEPVDHDWFLAMHSWDAVGADDPVPALGLADRLEHRRAAPGSRIRLRLLNSDRLTHVFSLTGTPFRVTALDGNPVRDPGLVSGKGLAIGAGARYDVEFVMPDRPVRLTETQDFVGALDRGLMISADGRGEITPDRPSKDFDPTAYGTPAPTPFGPDSRFSRTYSMVFDNELGFYDGKFTFAWTINGKVFPDGPHLTVREGDLVRLRFANRSHFDHPMHLHGHHVLVLSRNGRKVSGSPVWLDTVNVRVGEVWEVAFRADNPGIWMDHCHIGDHAVLGMMTHLSYENVTSPYRMGRDTDNQAE